MIEQKIDFMVQRLPIYLKKEVLDYIEFLSNKQRTNKKTKKKFRFDWEGGLADVKIDLTSVQLQHKAMEWR